MVTTPKMMQRTPVTSQVAMTVKVHLLTRRIVVIVVITATTVATTAIIAVIAVTTVTIATILITVVTIVVTARRGRSLQLKLVVWEVVVSLWLSTDVHDPLWFTMWLFDHHAVAPHLAPHNVKHRVKPHTPPPAPPQPPPAPHSVHNHALHQSTTPPAPQLRPFITFHLKLL